MSIYVQAERDNIVSKQATWLHIGMVFVQNTKVWDRGI